MKRAPFPDQRQGANEFPLAVDIDAKDRRAGSEGVQVGADCVRAGKRAERCGGREGGPLAAGTADVPG